MAVISGLTPITVPVPVGRVLPPGQGGFVVPRQTGRPAASPGSGRTGPTASISTSMVLALQEQVGREHADEDAKRHGHQLLDELARLQRALLSDGDAGSVQGLADLARIDIGDADPALAGVVSSIRLRARIELARRSRAPGTV